MYRGLSSRRLMAEFGQITFETISDEAIEAPCQAALHTTPNPLHTTTPTRRRL
jgi:hypothetical protein